MIAVLVIWFYIFLLIYLYGLAVFAGLRWLLRIDVAEAIELPLILLTGIMAITVLAMIVNLFIPLGLAFVVCLLAGGLLIASRKWSQVSVSWPSHHPATWIVLALMFLTVLENATHTPTNPDTGLYHAQTIRWFETYRIVSGLGNLQERFAFNSSWLVLNASLSLAFLGLRSFHLVNGVLFLSAMFYFTEGLGALAQKKITVPNLAKIFFLPLGFYLLGSDISSVGNDMPVSLMTWVILIVWLENLEAPSPSGIKNALIFLLSVFTVTLKLSSVPILCFAFLVMLEYLVKKNWRQALILGMLGGLILLPWLIRSVILSGYLVFLFSKIDLFSVDWKMSGQRIDSATNDIIRVARLGLNWTSEDTLSIWQWAPIWFEKETLNRKLIYMFVLFSPLMMLVYRYKLALWVSRKYYLTYGIMLAGSLFWFLSAPDIRFGYGFLMGTCALALSPLIASAIFKFDKNLRMIPSLILLLFIVFQTYTLWQSIEFPTLSQRWLLPADYRRSGVDACEIKGAIIYCKREGAQCHYEAFPCMPFSRPVELRGATFQDGFRFIQDPNP